MTKHNYSVVIAFSLALCLGGCGFQPLLTGDPSQAQRFFLQVNGAGYNAYKFRRELEKTLALTPKVNDKKYKVIINLSEAPGNTVIGQDATIQRSQMLITATYTVHLDNKEIYSGKAEAASSYTVVLIEEFATKNALLGATERAITVLSEELSRDIMRVIRS